MWCPECKLEGILNEMGRDWSTDDYYYKCDVCGNEYNERMQVLRFKKKEGKNEMER